MVMRWRIPGNRLGVEASGDIGDAARREPDHDGDGLAQDIVAARRSERRASEEHDHKPDPSYSRHELSTEWTIERPRLAGARKKGGA